MQKKTALTTLLSLLVVASVVYTIRGELMRASDPSPESAGAYGPQQATEPLSGEVALYAYYFHGTRRCFTCLQIEENTLAALERFFPGELSDESLRYRSVNVDLPENQHYRSRFELTMGGVVLAAQQDEHVFRWVALPQVWPLARDPERIQAYVSEELLLFMAED